MDSCSGKIEIRRRTDGVIDQGVPVSTLEPLALERGQMTVPLVTSMMSCYERVRLGDFLREEGRLKFFCRREAQISSQEVSTCAPPIIDSVLSCLDDLFGVEIAWPTELKAGELHRFLFIGNVPPGEKKEEGAATDDSHLPDRILINGRLAWRRAPGSTLAFAFDYVPAQDECPVLTLVKDRHFTLQSNPSRFYPGSTPAHHPILRLFTHLSLNLAVACEHHGGCHAATALPVVPLPGTFRRFLSPGPFAFPQDFDPPPWTEPPLELPPYPTDPVFIHDIADGYANQNLIDPYPERRAQQDRLCLDNGIRLFAASRADWIEAQGLQNSDRMAFHLYSYIIRGNPNDEEGIRAEIAKQRNTCLDLLRRFPNAQVFVRLCEFSGCQYHAPGLMPSMKPRLTPETGAMDWLAYVDATDGVYREVHEAAYAEPRRVGGERFKVFANIQMFNYTSAHAFRCGADFTMDKTIGRESVNLIVASSRGHNMAYGSPWIGMQHDNWGGIRYNYDGFAETTFVWRAFYLGGANVMDRETTYVGVRDGKVEPNRKGQAFLHVVRWMNRHPQRGRSRVKLAFMRGSEAMAGWGYPFYPETPAKGVYGPDPFRPKEYADWDLLAVAFPGILADCHRSNSRWMTGSPHGPCDVIPWDIPAARLAQYGVVVMLGEHVFENDRQVDNLIEAVRSGLTFVCSLSAFYGNRWQGAVYRETDISKLAGVELGEDVPLWVMRCSTDTTSNVSRHYNRVVSRGARVRRTLPNGDPWMVEHQLGKGRVLFVTTDRLTDLGFEPAAELIASLFAPLAPVRFADDTPATDALGLFQPTRPAALGDQEHVTFAGAQAANGFRVDQTVAARPGRTSWLDTSVFEKGALRLIGIQDYGRARVPTDNGPDLGPWTGRVTLNVANLGLAAAGELEVRAVDETFATHPVAAVRTAEGLTCELTIDGFSELLVGPAGKTERLFLYGDA